MEAVLLRLACCLASPVPRKGNHILRARFIAQRVSDGATLCTSGALDAVQTLRAARASVFYIQKCVDWKHVSIALKAVDAHGCPVFDKHAPIPFDIHFSTITVPSWEQTTPLVWNHTAVSCGSNVLGNGYVRFLFLIQSRQYATAEIRIGATTFPLLYFARLLNGREEVWFTASQVVFKLSKDDGVDVNETCCTAAARIKALLNA
jgi:hypothetical protein